MAEANYVNPYGTNSPREGYLNLDQGRFLIWGRATFTTTDQTCTITPRMGTRIDMILLTPGPSVTGLYYSAIDSDTGVVTVTRTDSTSAGEFSFMIVTRG